MPARAWFDVPTDVASGVVAGEVGTPWLFPDEHDIWKIRKVVKRKITVFFMAFPSVN
jgi:hypothetical protein